jgi:hypothetical protein
VPEKNARGGSNHRDAEKVSTDLAYVATAGGYA